MTDDRKHLPDPIRDGGICLALSGGGFRATLFHLGSLRRLNEMGLLGQIATISSVSGGSIMSLCLAKVLIDSPLDKTGRISDFNVLSSRVHKLTTSNLRRRIFLKRIEPSNWGTTLPELVAKELEHHVTGVSLIDLPRVPRFIFCATDMAFGVNWMYSRESAGDYQAGYKTSGLHTIKIAHAAAASACFPPVFKPMKTQVPHTELRGGAATGDQADECRQRIRLSDGGVYDNMGLEPVWKRAKTLLVSDAGGVFEYAPDRGTIAEIQRYPDIVGNQARAVRKRWLISSFINGTGPGGRDGLSGTYWSTSNVRKSYDDNDNSGYSKPVAKLIASIRTDLNSFSDGETAALENHGYLLADIAIKVYLPHLYKSDPPAKAPYEAWLDEKRVTEALKDSAKRHL